MLAEIRAQNCAPYEAFADQISSRFGKPGGVVEDDREDAPERAGITGAGKRIRDNCLLNARPFSRKATVPLPPAGVLRGEAANVSAFAASGASGEIE